MLTIETIAADGAGDHFLAVNVFLVSDPGDLAVSLVPETSESETAVGIARSLGNTNMSRIGTEKLRKRLTDRVLKLRRFFQLGREFIAFDITQRTRIECVGASNGECRE